MSLLAASQKPYICRPHFALIPPDSPLTERWVERGQGGQRFNHELFTQFISLPCGNNVLSISCIGASEILYFKCSGISPLPEKFISTIPQRRLMKPQHPNPGTSPFALHQLERQMYPFHTINGSFMDRSGN